MKQKALQLAKEKWENFYNANAARNPGEVAKYQKLIDWLKTATEADIEVTEKQMHLKPITFECRLVGHHHFGNTIEEMRDNFTITGYLSDDKEFVRKMGYIGDVHYSEHANDAVMPDTRNLEAMLGSFGYSVNGSGTIAGMLYEDRYPDYNYSAHSSSVLDRQFGTPFAATYYDCQLNFQDNGKVIPINFGIVNDKIKWFDEPRGVKKGGSGLGILAKVVLGFLFWPYGAYLCWKGIKYISEH